MAGRARDEHGPAERSVDRALAWIVCNATVFVAAACVMTVEILSTRLVAPFLGSSLFTWTSAIGVVLGGISLGNYAGGRIADRCEPRRTLAVLFVASSLACVTIPLLNRWIGAGALLAALSWPTRIFLHFSITFLVPATLLGTMSPVVAKRALRLGLATGRTIGTLYAWGAIGSIVGTFVAGFWLMAWTGTEAALLWVGGVLAIMGLLYGYRSWFPYAGTAAYGVTLLAAVGPWDGTRELGVALALRHAPDESVLFLEDSNYQRVVVREEGGRLTMTLDALLHSQMDPARPSELQYDYERIYAEVLRRAHPPAEPIDAFFIGGGGYVFPRYVEETYPGSHVEVAEIDPVVTRAAFEAFRLPRDTSVRAFDMDARNRVAELVRARRSGEPVPAFDFVFGDAFHDLSVPWHLSTVEFCEDLAALMSDDGVYLLNLIDGYGYGRFLGAVIRTCRAVFPHVEVVAATPVLSERSTFVVVASKRPLDLTGIDDAIRERREFGGERLEADQIARLEALDGGMLLTDDHAPVENLLAEIATRRPRIDVPDVLARAIAAMEAGRRSEAQATLREALALAPTDPRLLNELGRVLAESGDTEGAREAFAGAVHWQPHVPRYRANLALALLDSGRPIEAATELEACLELDPQNAAAANTLARLRASAADERLRDGAEAVRWAEHLAELVGRDQPEVADTLALAYAAAGRFDEARGWVARASKLAETQGRPDLVDSIRAHAAAFAAGRAWIEPER